MRPLMKNRPRQCGVGSFHLMGKRRSDQMLWAHPYGWVTSPLAVQVYVYWVGSFRR